jgi:flagellar biosynthetic protein FliR
MIDLNTIVAQAPYFMMVFIRLSAFMTFVPFFENRNFIMPIKVGFAFLFSLVLFPAIPVSSWTIPDNVPGFMLTVIQEIMVGVLMGLAFMVVLFALQLAGRMVGFQMAFSLANVVDPAFGENANVLSVFLVLLGTLLAVTMGADHYLLLTISKSFEILAPGSMVVSQAVINDLSALVIKAFVIGFKLSAPAIILLLCIDVTLGLIGKTSTKMQIFFVGLPLKISVGLFSISIILGFVLSLWGKEVSNLPVYLLRLFHLMRG